MIATFVLGFPVKCAYNDPVGAFADFVDVFIATVDDEGELGRYAWPYSVKDREYNGERKRQME